MKFIIAHFLRDFSATIIIFTVHFSLSPTYFSSKLRQSVFYDVCDNCFFDDDAYGIFAIFIFLIAGKNENSN